MKGTLASPLTALLQQANEVILGKEQELKLVLCCLLARGHLLIEDQPGMGKTTLAKTFAKLLGLQFNRIQFTSDLLPSDLLGVSIFDEHERKFVFHPGPIFSQFILGDELNRASPKTQSACLQAMEEAQITVDGKTHNLPTPFLFVATQNPNQSLGTFPLPQSQLDRFLMKIELGFPSELAEKKLLQSENLSQARIDLIDTLPNILSVDDLLAAQKQVDQIQASDPILQYILNLVRESRKTIRGSNTGLSPRAGIDLLKAAKSWAFLSDRDYVIPEDVQSIFAPVTHHRFGDEEENGKSIAQSLVGRVPVL